MLNTVLLQEQVGSSSSGLIMMVLIFVIFYFFMIRPQTKRQKEIKKFRDALMVGDHVVTGGGIYGKVKEIKDLSVIVEIANNVNIQVDKNSVFADPSSANQSATTK